MEICSVGHDEVCFEGVHCPMCDLKMNYDDKIAELMQQIDEMEIEKEGKRWIMK